jgi:radical SAM protein with 4Fe4S-binding SPASM domain
VTNNATLPTYALTGCNWELTLRCTLNCFHCGSRAGKARPNELSLDECFSVADELVALGCEELTMIGGEVFLFRGWDRLSEYLTDKGISVNIVTNGYRVGEAEVEQIKRAKLTNVGISIDGMEANHNKIRGRTDAFHRLRNTLDLLNKEGISIAAVTSLMNFNCADLEDLYVFLLEHGVQVWQLQLVNSMGNLAGKNEFAISPGQVRQVIEFIRDKSWNRKIMVIAADSIGYFDENETYIRGRSSPIPYWGGCSAGISSVFIDSIGNVKGCGAIYSEVFIEGNVRKTSLTDIWNNENAFAYNRKFTTDLLSGKCKGCEAGELCRGGCRASNYFSTQSLYSNVFCCR